MNNKKIEKNGSALILVILLLSFFMAISLNLLYMSEEKGKRAGYKIVGQKHLSYIDESSSIGYYELYLADKYVKLGYIYDDTNTIFTGSKKDYFGKKAKYENYSSLGYFPSIPTTSEPAIAGVVIGNYIDYFTSYWNVDFNSTDQAIIILENKTSGKVDNRTWTNYENKVVKLWYDPSTTKQSIGGYKLLDITYPNGMSDFSSFTSGNNYDFEVKYIKTLVFPEIIESGKKIVEESIYDINVYQSISLETLAGYSSSTTIDKDKINIISQNIDKIEVIKRKK
ncbi:hypothetical protein EV215_1330 [Hypnocyclicus thermotrophus]|uniref:Uncharacterized protein n=1 Tax=Hypnocyclicus thermotrophus TaxID=1627895 RepID=A0AA46DY82_9FUSO|nr:hypothetical protein [Hypnocyclicus thermotrophus]TDT69791.1 hypothetical protein EV215_1330 [Hypnocyclicus thermotrophus]